MEPDNANAVVKEVVETVTKNFAELVIDIPNIVRIPSSDVTYGFDDFDLDGLETLNFKPVSRDILIRLLRTNKSTLLSSSGSYDKEQNPENYIIRGLIDHDLVDYDEHADLLYKLAGQVVERFRSYLFDESKVENVLINNQSKITDFIVEQLRQHYWETPAVYRVSISGFITFKPFSCRIQHGSASQDFGATLKEKSGVTKIVFHGFTKCCYPLQKFDSVDGELQFARILEGDDKVIRWLKPAAGFFPIEYKNGLSYEPDFVVETADAKYLCEPKMASEMKTETVLAKKKAAVRWCKHATEHAQKNDGNPWHYALIPHDAITPSRSFDGLMREFMVPV